MNGISSSYSNYIAGYNNISNKSNSGYLSQLQARHKSLNISVASAVPTLDSMRGKTRELSIHPSILQEMQNDPEKERYYDQRIKDIEAALDYTNGLIESMGCKRTTSFTYIDEDGKIWGGGIVERKDMLNEKLREEARRNTEAFLAESLENGKKARNDVEDVFRKELVKELNFADSVIKASHHEAVSVSISDEAKELFRQEKLGNLTPVQDLPFESVKKGAVAPRERAELVFQENFREGTAENFIFNALDGKVENAYDVARQLGGMIFSRESDIDVETRAFDRETGKKLAEYIAQSYLTNSDEAESFLAGIDEFANKSEMRDKGYTVIIGSDIEPFKPQLNDLQQFAKENFGYTDIDWSDTEKSSKIVKAYTTEVMKLARNETQNSKYSEKTLPSFLNYDSTPYMHKEEKAAFSKAFDENEKKVQAMIDAANTCKRSRG